LKKIIFPAIVLAALCLFNAGITAQTQTYTVTNSSGMVITGLSLSPNDLNTWGENMNTTGGSIAADKSFQFTRPVDRSNCIYDVRYQVEDGTYYYVQNVDLCTSTNVMLSKTDSKEYMRDDMKKDSDMKHDGDMKQK
jgi:hypothetical protein